MHNVNTARGGGGGREGWEGVREDASVSRAIALVSAICLPMVCLLIEQSIFELLILKQSANGSMNLQIRCLPSYRKYFLNI